MTIQIERECQVELEFPVEEIITLVVEEALSYENCPYDIELNVLLTDNAAIQEINREQRGKDEPTDVLSFPMIHYEAAGDFSGLEADADNFNPDTGEVILGDIVLNADRAKEQAEKYGHSQMREFAFLIVHSMLHLFGYDHMTEEDAARMEEVQRMILEEMHILR